MEPQPKNQKKQTHAWAGILAVYSLAVVLLLLTFSQYTTTDYQQYITRQRQDSLRRMVQLAYNTVSPLVDQVRDGSLTRDQARRDVSDLVRGMIYQDEFGPNYIFMSTYDGVMLVQPYEPDKEGTNQWSLQDPDGSYIIQELARAAQAAPEGSFVTYTYILPDLSGVDEKLSFVMGIPELEAYIGTGMYLESSYRTLGTVLRQQRLGSLAVALFILVSLLAYALVLALSNRRLRREIQERVHAEENLWTVFNTIHDAIVIHDEAGRVLHVNEQASILYGLPPEEMLQYTIRDISDKPETLKEWYKYVQKHINKQGYIVFEWKARRPRDGGLLDVEIALRKTQWSGTPVFVGAVRDITEQKQYVEQVRSLAYFDSLTGLPNRTYIMGQLKKCLGRCSAQLGAGAIYFIDIDDFKVINDTHGHTFGDRVLVEIARRLETLPSPGLTLSRLGGDEFLILASDSAGRAHVLALADQILELFRDPIAIDGISLPVTCSIGIAGFPQDGRTVTEIMQHADLAMYQAKTRGRDQYVLYNSRMAIEFSRRTELEKRLKEAYQNGEFRLHYQPQAEIESGRILGLEALLRWDSGPVGLTSPTIFIQVAEEIGLINDIGRWAIDHSFAFARRLMDRGLCISCNVSPLQLRQADFVSDVLEAFDRHGLCRGSVALEITESCLVESFSETYAKLAQLRAHGILIYLDDFGTGYSSLNSMKSLPIDVLKIDKSFVDNITADGVDGQIVKTIVSLARGIGLRVIAEGVETTQQRDCLLDCGCGVIQGHLFGAAVPEEAVPELLDRHVRGLPPAGAPQPDEAAREEQPCGP